MSINKESYKVSYYGKKEVFISEVDRRVCYFYSLQKKKKASENINHHILLLDVSQSMINEIDELKKRTKETFEAFKKSRNNYVSLIIYSGHGEAKRIINAVRCDNISYKMAGVYKSIDTEICIKSITVMSEPLEQAIDIVKSLGDICNKHHIVLFTDGCIATTKWSIKEEEEKVIKIAKLCNEKAIFLNAIGFGKYYDRNFLKKIVSISGTGNFNHIDEIKEYHNMVIKLSNEIDKVNIAELEIKNKNFFVIESSEYIKENKKLKTKFLNGEINIVVFDEELILNEKLYKYKKNIEVHSRLIEDFLYSLTKYYLLHDNIENAKFTLAQTGDINAFNLLNNCYSFIEKGRAIKEISKYLYEIEKRFAKGKQEIIIPALQEEPLCLLEVLQAIISDNNSKLLWDYSYLYKRIGQKAMLLEDKFSFIRPKCGYGEIVSISIGSKKLNIGVKVKIDGQVVNSINDLKLDAHIFREYNLILNGNINTEYIWCKLSKELKRRFKKEKIIKSVSKLFGEEIVTLDLKKLKTTNSRLYKSLRPATIAEYLYRIEELNCSQWVINKLLKDKKGNLAHIKEEINEKDRIKSIYRVDNTGLYHPLSVTDCEVKDHINEIYLATVLEWKVEKFPRKRVEEIALGYYKGLLIADNSYNINILNRELEKVKKEKKELEHNINIIRIAAALNKTSIFLWDKEEEREKKEIDKVLGINKIVGGKVKISRKLVNDINVRQDEYIVLTICD